MKKRIAAWMEARTPRLYHRYWRARMYWTHRRRTKLAQSLSPVVQAGPFAGLRFPPEAASTKTLPMLLGSYERELHSVIYSLKPRRAVVNIGCGEGYYAVGFALLWPDCSVTAFETDAEARSRCQNTAKLNDVANRVIVCGQATRQDLNDVQPNTLVVCDSAGGEFELLDPDAVPALRHCEILAELHDWGVSGAPVPLAPEPLPTTVLNRFAATHRAQIVSIEKRSRVEEQEYRTFARCWVWLQPLSLDEKAT